MSPLAGKPGDFTPTSAADPQEPPTGHDAESPPCSELKQQAMEPQAISPPGNGETDKLSNSPIDERLVKAKIPASSYQDANLIIIIIEESDSSQVVQRSSLSTAKGLLENLSSPIPGTMIQTWALRKNNDGYLWDAYLSWVNRVNDAGHSGIWWFVSAVYGSGPTEAMPPNPRPKWFIIPALWYLGVRLADKHFMDDIVRATIVVGNRKKRGTMPYAFLADTVRVVWELECSGGRFDGGAIGGNVNGGNPANDTDQATTGENSTNGHQESRSKSLGRSPTEMERMTARLEGCILLKAMLDVFVRKADGDGLDEALRKLPLPIKGLLAAAQRPFVELPTDPDDSTVDKNKYTSNATSNTETTNPAAGNTASAAANTAGTSSAADNGNSNANANGKAKRGSPRKDAAKDAAKAATKPT